MNTQLQQLQAEGQMDADSYRNCMVLTVLAKLLMASILGVIAACSYMLG